METKLIKVYVAIAAEFDSEGRLIPTEVTWEDGTEKLTMSRF